MAQLEPTQLKMEDLPEYDKSDKPGKSDLANINIAKGDNDEIGYVPKENQNRNDEENSDFVSQHPFVIDEVVKVIRPLGQKAGLPQTYGFALFRNGTTQVLAASGQINPNAGIVTVGGLGGAVTLTSNPNIIAGIAGQILILEGTSDTNTLTLTNGNGVKLSGAITLGIRDTLTLIYNGTYFLEIARSNNT